MKTKLFSSLIVVALLGGVRQAAAQGTAFTYQGQLSANGGPANGSYDFRFAIFDSAAAANQIGSSLTNSATPVSAGLFTVTLDFGSGVFTGPARFLEVGVRSNATGAFTVLNPLQPLTPAPYAIAAANLLGTLPASQLPSGVVTNNQFGVNINGNLSGNGSGLTNTPGTLVWQLPSTSSVQAQPNTSYLLANNQQIVTLTLPSSPNVGDVVQVVGKSTAGWVLAQNAGQAISGQFYPLWNGIGAPINISWQSIASSSDGTHLVLLGDGHIFTSINSGTNWTEQALAPVQWSVLASSSDGTHLAGGGYGPFATSINSGTNWTQQPSAPTLNWESIASSSDGTHLAAVGNWSAIYTSTDSGTNWTLQTNSPNVTWYCIASSSDGTHLAVLDNNGGIYTSTNSGTNWTEQAGAPVNYFQCITSSSDGTKLAAVDESGDIYTSTNSGTNWTLQTSQPNCSFGCIASSSDGTHLAAGDWCGDIYTSTNSGTNWTKQGGAPAVNYWNSITSSSDGTKLAALAQNSSGTGFFTSSNAGTNWTWQAGAALPTTSFGTTVGNTGYLQGAAQSNIELVYAGSGNFVEISQFGTIYAH